MRLFGDFWDRGGGSEGKFWEAEIIYVSGVAQVLLLL